MYPMYRMSTVEYPRKHKRETPRCQSVSVCDLRYDTVASHILAKPKPNSFSLPPPLLELSIMRLFLFLLFTLLVAVLGRRGSTPPPETLKKRAILSLWGYPYGWGLGVIPMDEEPANDAEDTEKVKQVKRGM
jgi:hypothetical protein